MGKFINILELLSTELDANIKSFQTILAKCQTGLSFNCSCTLYKQLKVAIKTKAVKMFRQDKLIRKIFAAILCKYQLAKVDYFTNKYFYFEHIWRQIDYTYDDNPGRLPKSASNQSEVGIPRRGGRAGDTEL